MALSIIATSSIALGTNVQAATFASTNANSNVITPSSTVNSGAPVMLVDGSSATQTVTKGITALFFTNVNDNDLRNIVISSSSKVKTRILPSSANGLPVQYNSGNYRPFNMIAWHFIPGVQYSILVETEDTADVTVSMSKAASSAFSWIYQGSSTTVEQNYLYGGQTETYGIGVEQDGTYNINVASAGKLTVTCSKLASSIDLNSNGYTFTNVVINNSHDSKGNPTYDQTGFVLYLKSNDVAGTSSSYTVSVQKVK